MAQAATAQATTSAPELTADSAMALAKQIAGAPAEDLAGAIKPDLDHDAIMSLLDN